jgi:hypothetical protein
MRKYAEKCLIIKVMGLIIFIYHKFVYKKIVLMDYSKWDAMAKEEEAEEKRQKEQQRTLNKMKVCVCAYAASNREKYHSIIKRVVYVCVSVCVCVCVCVCVSV